jgi:RNA polymerase-binding transcription factor DksA
MYYSPADPTEPDFFGYCEHCGNPIEDEERAESNFCSYNCETLNILY